MEPDQTKWIDEEFLKLAISDGRNDEHLTIANFNIKPAVESGNNYCTQLFRVRVDYQRGNTEESKSLIIKAPLAEGSTAKEVIDETNFLENEYIMYNQILPEINAIAKQRFGPKIYFCERKDVLVMDDLIAEGFTMGDRLKQLDLQHCRQFLTTLGKYHATTVVLHNRNPQVVELNGTHPLYNEDMKSQTLRFFENIKRGAFFSVVQKLNGLEELSETIQRCKNLRDALVKTFKRRGKLNVLNHGDCWTNNIMFKYTDEGEILDCQLIDFQIRSYGSPATDLLYFLFTSAREEVRQNHTGELLQLYCDTLNTTLQEHNIAERLSVQELQAEMRHACPWAVHVVINYLPMILNEPDAQSAELAKNKENLKSLDINVNPAMRIFLGKTYNAVLPGVCKELIDLGVIDYFKSIDN